MKRLALTAVAGLLFVAACQDMSTDPAPAVQGGEVASGFGVAPANPPPPPIDSGAVGVAGEAESGGETSSQMSFSVTYMLNKPENTGWLKFNKDQNNQTDVDNSAAIKMTNGVFSGRGTIRISDELGTFIIDLSKVSFGDGTSFNECTAPTAPSVTTDGKPSCFQLDLGGPGAQFVTKAGASSQARFTLFPGYVRGDECAGSLREACTISVGQ